MSLRRFEMQQKVTNTYSTKSTITWPVIDMNMEECICLRSPRTLQCTGCGYITKGRASRTCRCHPTVIFLLDFTACPRCDTHAEYMNEYVLAYFDDDTNNNTLK